MRKADTAEAVLAALLAYGETHDSDGLAWTIEPPAQGQPWDVTIGVMDREAFISSKMTAEFVADPGFPEFGPKLLLHKLARFKERGRPTAATSP